MTDKKTLKLALEYLRDNQHYIADNERHVYVMEYNAFVERLEALVEQPAQQQEPWPKEPFGHIAGGVQSAQQPVAWPEPVLTRPFQSDFENGHDAGWNDCLEACKEASPPASKPWMGLTDDEYSQLHDGLYQQGKSLGWVVDQAEAKLREKNNG